MSTNKLIDAFEQLDEAQTIDICEICAKTSNEVDISTVSYEISEANYTIGISEDTARSHFEYWCQDNGIKHEPEFICTDCAEKIF